MEGYGTFQEDDFGYEAGSTSKLKQSKELHVLKKSNFKKKKMRRNLKLKRNPKMKCTQNTNISKTNIKRKS